FHTGAASARNTRARGHCRCVDCAFRFDDGHAFPSRPPPHGKRLTSPAAVLLGTQRNHVGNRFGGNSYCRCRLWFSGGYAFGQRLLFARRRVIATDDSISREILGRFLHALTLDCVFRATASSLELPLRPREYVNDKLSGVLGGRATIRQVDIDTPVAGLHW